MALTRAQLLMGNNSDGTIVLTGQPQGVRPGGAGISIAPDGIISVDSQSIIGVMKLGQTAATAAAAYNQYEWPTTAATVGQQLEIFSVAGGIATLKWADADGIDWTAKGQLIVGTGLNTDILLNAGVDTSFLMADSASASGLSYSDSISSAVLLPQGIQGNRPAAPVSGQFRLNTTNNRLEF